MGLQVFADRRAFPLPEAFDERLGELFEGVVRRLAGRGVHGRNSTLPPGMAPRATLSRRKVRT